MLLVKFTRYLDERSWSRCAIANRSLRSHMHSRASLRHSVTRPLQSDSRRRFWRCLLGDMFSGAGRNVYQSSSESTSPIDAEIRRDICRTYPDDLDDPATEVLFRVLRAVAHRVEDISYCQGMNFIAGILLRVFGPSEEALLFECMVSLLLRHGMNQFFGYRFPKLRITALQFDCLVHTFLPDLGFVFETYNVTADFYATQWFLTLFGRSLPYEHVVRVWDVFLCRGMKFLHRVGLALLKEARPRLLGMKFEEIVQELISLGMRVHMTPDDLICAADKFKVTNKLLCELQHALLDGGSTGPHGERNLPSCVLERDLDAGSAQWRLIPSQTPTPSSSPQRQETSRSGAPPRQRCHSASLDETLPAMLVPMDPCMSNDYVGSFNGDDLDSLASTRSPSPAKIKRMKKIEKLGSKMVRKAKRAILHSEKDSGAVRFDAPGCQQSPSTENDPPSSDGSSRCTSVDTLDLDRRILEVTPDMREPLQKQFSDVPLEGPGRWKKLRQIAGKSTRRRSDSVPCVRRSATFPDLFAGPLATEPHAGRMSFTIRNLDTGERFHHDKAGIMSPVPVPVRRR